MNFKKLIKIALSLLVTLSGVTSLFYLIINKGEVKETFWKVNQSLLNKIRSKKTGSDEFWAREILNGGYILYFRHAERDKWTDVYMFDALESSLQNKSNDVTGRRFAENDYFEDAVCLNKRGKIQAQGMKEIIKFSKLPIGNIISSPSCRARQTAELVFGKYDNLNKALIHKGTFLENENERKNFLKDYLTNLQIKKGTNTVITAHNSVLDNDDIFDKVDSKLKLRLGEGGFFIISNRDKKLELKHTFNKFSSFSKTFFPRVFE